MNTVYRNIQRCGLIVLVSLWVGGTVVAQEKYAHPDAIEDEDISNLVDDLGLTWAKAELRGKVKTYTHKSFEDDGAGGKSGPKSVSEYNAKGKLVEVNHYTAAGKLDGKTALKYDFRDSLREANVFYVDKGIHAFRFMFKYDTAGNKTDLVYEPYPKLKYRIVHIYNKAGLETERLRYDAKDSLVARYVVQYNEKGQGIEIAAFARRGVPAHKEAYAYNDKERTSTIRWYFGNGELRDKSVLTHNEAGQLTSEHFYGSEKTLDSKTTYKYDSKGNKTEQIRIPYTSGKENVAGKSVTKTTYKYDGTGNFLEKTTSVTDAINKGKIERAVNEFIYY